MDAHDGRHAQRPCASARSSTRVRPPACSGGKNPQAWGRGVRPHRGRNRRRVLEKVMNEMRPELRGARGQQLRHATSPRPSSREMIAFYRTPIGPKKLSERSADHLGGCDALGAGRDPQTRLPDMRAAAGDTARIPGADAAAAAARAQDELRQLKMSQIHDIPTPSMPSGPASPPKACIAPNSRAMPAASASSRRRTASAIAPRRRSAAIDALKAVWHRGAVDADGKTGDGAGIHVELPRRFLRTTPSPPPATSPGPTRASPSA